MTKSAACLLLVGALLVVGGVAQYSVRAATVLAGLMFIIVGVGMVDLKPRAEKRAERR